MTTLTAFGTSASAKTHYKTFPIGAPIPFIGRNNRTIVNTANTSVLNLSDTPTSNFNVDVYYSVERSSTVPIKKVVNRSRFVKINCANNAGSSYGPWSLGLPDVYAIEGVYIGSGSYSNTGVNYANNFTLDNGQRDSHYDLASISLNGTSVVLSNTSTILVQLSHFTIDQSQGVGFFLANSYPIDDVNSANNNAIMTQQIPIYTSTKGSAFDLRDCVDFRAVSTNTAVSTNSISSATINPSANISFAYVPYLPTPDANFQTDLQYYLQRADRISIDTNGNVIVSEGIPASNNPQAPVEKNGTMTLGIVSIPPYPSLPSQDASYYNRYDYAITSSLLQNKRYTMKDIGGLETRIKNLEYYTSLSLLEQSATNLQVRSSITGQNRFQNGIFVDPFKGFDLSNTLDDQFYIAIDSSRSELRPSFKQYKSTFIPNIPISTNVVQHGELVMLAHTSNNVYSSQNYASKYRNCIEGNVFEWSGIITLNPAGATSPDITTSPDVINNLDLASNWINLANAWGTQWGNWITTSTTSTPTAIQSSATNTVTNADGSVTSTLTTQTINQTSTTQQQSGTTLNADTSTSQIDLGTFVTNVDILPYLPSRTITYQASGMKPNTRLYAFFGNISVSSFCAPTTNSYSGTGNKGDVYSGIIGDPIYSDSSGNVYGIFYLPPNTFKTQDNAFVLTDISDLTQGADAIQTNASAIFYGSTLSISQGSSILNTRNVVINSNEVTQSQTLQGVSVSTNQTTTVTPPPPIVIHNPPIDFTYTGGTGSDLIYKDPADFGFDSPNGPLGDYGGGFSGTDDGGGDD